MYKRAFEQLLGITLPFSPKGEVLVNCPWHEDKKPSLSINYHKGIYYCFGCGAKGSIFSLAKEYGYRVIDGELVSLDEEKKIKKKEDIPLGLKKERYGLYEYAEEKGISLWVLANKFQAGEEESGVVFPYFDKESNLVAKRYRYKKKMWWEKGAKIIPYGLWLLHDEIKELWIVEGESDTQTLWMNDIPAVGFPGANTPKPEFFECIDEIPCEWNIVVENDTAGIGFIEKIYQVLLDYFPHRLSSTYVILMEDIGKKDINEIWLLKKDKDFFQQKLDFLRTIRIQLVVAYQNFVQNEKWVDPSCRRIAMHLVQGLDAFYDNKVFYVWDKERKVWKQEDDKWFLENFLTSKMILKSGKKRVVLDILKYFLHNKKKPPVLSSEWIVFKNKAIHIETGEEMVVDKNYFYQSRLGWDYNPKESNKKVDLIFKDWVKDVDYLYELIGYCMIRDYPGNKWFILFGRGRNGKSTFLQLLRTVLNGKEDMYQNVSNVSLEQILSDKFASAMLLGKLANISGEMSYSKLYETRIIKDLTGGELIMAQKKFGQLFEFRNYAKLIFATNKVPQTIDTTEGFFRRVIIIDFKEIPKNKIDPFLLKKLNDDDYEYIVYKGFQALINLYKRGFIFKIEQVENMRQKYSLVSNPLRLFIDCFCEVTHNDTDMVITQDFIDKFRRWCEETQMATMKNKEIFGEMEEMGFYRKRTRRLDGSLHYCFCGLKWKRDVKEEDYVGKGNFDWMVGTMERM